MSVHSFVDGTVEPSSILSHPQRILQAPFKQTKIDLTNTVMRKAESDVGRKPKARLLPAVDAREKP